VGHLLAQTSSDLLNFLDAGGTIGVIVLVLTLALSGRLRFDREVAELVKQVNERDERLKGYRDVLDRERAAWEAERETLWAAYRDQASAREAAERSASNAIESGRITIALLDALRGVAAGKEAT